MRKYTSLKMIARFIKGVTASLGVALILQEKYPITTIIVLAIGAGTIELLNFIDELNNSRSDENLK